MRSLSLTANEVVSALNNRVMHFIKSTSGKNDENPVFKEIAELVYDDKILWGEFLNHLQQNKVVTSVGVKEHFAKFLQEKNIQVKNNYETADNSTNLKNYLVSMLSRMHILTARQNSRVSNKSRAFSWNSHLSSMSTSSELRKSYFALNYANLKRFSMDPENMEATEVYKETFSQKNRLAGKHKLFDNNIDKTGRMNS